MLVNGVNSENVPLIDKFNYPLTISQESYDCLLVLKRFPGTKDCIWNIRLKKNTLAGEQPIIFHLEVKKEEFTVITKAYPQFKSQTKLFKLVREAMDSNITRSSFGYFFASQDLNIKLNDNIQEKLRGKCLRKPTSLKDPIILRILWNAQDDSKNPLIFWLVLEQVQASSYVTEYNNERILELESNVEKLFKENMRLKESVNYLKQYMMQLRIDFKQFRRKNLFEDVTNFANKVNENFQLLDREKGYHAKVQCLLEISKALLNCDVDFDLVVQFKESVQDELESAESEQPDFVKSVFISHLCDLIDPWKVSTLSSSFNNVSIGSSMGQFENVTKPLLPRKGSKDVFLVCGLKGSGKTTTSLQFANFYKLKGHKAAVICADTSASLNLLKIQADELNIPFYGSDVSENMLEIVNDGLFALSEFDLIIIDVAGFEAQTDHFGSIHSILDMIEVTDVLFVADCSKGSACGPIAASFRSSIPVNQCIVTNVNHEKALGAMSSIACTGMCITFLSTGTHVSQFQRYDIHYCLCNILKIDSVSEELQKESIEQ